MARRRTEVLTGAATVVLGAAIIGGLYIDKPDGKDGYPLEARFQKADGVRPGTEVRLSGMTVGQVVATRLDQHFRAVVTMNLHPSVRLSTDSAAAIHTDGLLGAKYISLQPGGDERMLPPGDMIRYSQDAVVIEDLLETIIAEAKRRRAAEQQGDAGGG